jgi:heat shock protein HslJ
MSARRRALPALVAVAAALLLGACGSSAPPDAGPLSASASTTSTAIALPVPSQARLLGSWSVVALPLEKTGVDKRLGFGFDKVGGELNARASNGCNEQWGTFTLTDEGRVRLDGLGTTQVACPTTRTDSRHIDAMYAARTVGLDDRSGVDQLVFRDEDERIVLVLQRIPPLSMGALLGTWQVATLGGGTAPRRPLAMDFQLVGTAGSVVTGDGCSSATAEVLLSGQYDIRFGAPVIVTRPCTATRDDRLVRSLTQIRSARTDLTGDPQRVTLLTRDGNPVVVLERAG